MAFLELVNQRYSTRRYNPDRPVDRALIDTCLEAARLAPSACNAQPWRFIIVDEPDLRRRVAGETYSRLVKFNRFADNAPVLLVVVAEESSKLPQLGGLLRDTRYSLMDIGIAAEHLCLQAAELGLGTCMLGWFNESALRRILGVPSRRRIALVITLGYSADAEQTPSRSRKSLDQIRTFNK